MNELNNYFAVKCYAIVFAMSQSTQCCGVNNFLTICFYKLTSCVVFQPLIVLSTMSAKISFLCLIFDFLDRLWTAPELLRNGTNGTDLQKADVYSFGVIVHEIIGLLGPWGETRLGNKGMIIC